MNKKKLQEQLDALKIFPNTNLVRQLRNQIKGKIKKLEKKELKLIKKPNQSRKNKLRKYHNYIRQIRNNFPELSYRQIRKQFAKRKAGDHVSISDVVWQNPSP